MIGLLKSIRTRFVAFGKEEKGSATLDFVIALPMVAFYFGSAYEGGVLSMRNVVLQHAVDATVRQVRIGQIPFATHENLTETICEYGSIIPDCDQNLRLEMVRIDPRNWVEPASDVACVDREDQGNPVINFNPGLNNELMVLRVCALFDPMMPTTGLGKEIPKKSGGAYALVATSSYVMEPFQ